MSSREREAPKRAAPCEAGQALALSSLPPELLARVVAALSSIADVCRAERVSRLFHDAAPRSVVEEALWLRAWAKAEAAAERAAAAKAIAAKEEVAAQAAKVTLGKAKEGEARSAAAEAAAAEAAAAVEAAAREAEAEAEAKAGAAEVERLAAAALLAALPEGETSWKRWLVLQERRREVSRPLPVDGGWSHSAFVDAVGRLLTCGNPVVDEEVGEVYVEHQLGQGADVAAATVPAAVLGLEGVRVVSVAAGDGHTLALSAEGAVYSFGEGWGGQLGHGDMEVQHAARRVTALEGERVTEVACGDGFSVALTDTGRAYSWGYTRAGIGHGALVEQLTPRRIEALAGMRIWAVAAGEAHCLALADMGAMYSWGEGTFGQLGHGDHVDQLTPRRVEELINVRVTAVAGGHRHSLAVSGTGALYSWGRGEEGQLGHGDQLHQPLPKVVEALGQVAVHAVAASGRHSLALSEAGEVYSWGAGEDGQLGHGDDEDQREPVRIAGLGGVCVSAIAGGHHHSLAIGSEGAVYGWGVGGEATLGLELTQDQLVPRRYPSLRAIDMP